MPLHVEMNLLTSLIPKKINQIENLNLDEQIAFCGAGSQRNSRFSPIFNLDRQV